jgi:hypothetical protein
MANPEMPNIPNIPGMTSMTDTLEFVKKLWGGMGIPGAQGAAPGMSMPGIATPGMNIPGMVMPTLSVEEINKKITDLKAVESWLALNMNMLRGTIQALEVQAATLNALNAMGQTVSATMKAAGVGDPGAMAGGSAGGNGTGAARSGAGASSAAAGGGEGKAQGASQPSAQDAQDAASLTAPLVNAAAWWNLLQDQFQQAVGNAMAAEPGAAQEAGQPKTKTKPAAAGGRKSKPPKE